MFFKATYKGLGISFGNDHVNTEDFSQEDLAKVQDFMTKMPALSILENNFIVIVKRVIFSEDNADITHIISMKRRFRSGLKNKIYYLSTKRA
jgi:hypothetical protein